MAGYSSYSYKSVKTKFGLQGIKRPLFANVTDIAPSDWLITALRRGNRFSTVSEKSRSEWFVAPILSEVKERNMNQLGILSGENLDVDKDLSLTGECDFVFVRNPDAMHIETPILCLIEAEKHDIPTGLGQCVAQMIGARMLNEQEGKHFPAIYGCVTTGRDWQFLKLEGTIVTLHDQVHYLNEVPRLLGIFQVIIDEF